jgi:AcrR family transcriptional regulator
MVTSGDGNASSKGRERRSGRGRHSVNSDATRGAIRNSAEQLFRRLGYGAVTMRQIASDAGCSHTAIYRYFPDKSALLEALAIPVLERLAADFEDLASQAAPAEERLVDMCLGFVRFGLTNRNMFRLLFMAGAERVDQEPSRGRVSALRNGLFDRVRRLLAEALGINPGDEAALRYARGLSYLLHGMIGTYEESDETEAAILARLETTFVTAIRGLVAGFTSDAVATGTETIGAAPNRAVRNQRAPSRAAEEGGMT